VPRVLSTLSATVWRVRSLQQSKGSTSQIVWFHPQPRSFSHRSSCLDSTQTQPKRRVPETIDSFPSRQHTGSGRVRASAYLRVRETVVVQRPLLGYSRMARHPERTHNPKVPGSNPAPATKRTLGIPTCAEDSVAPCVGAGYVGGTSVPAKTCHASADFASRLRRINVRSPTR
jgi:hypothetical protein